MGGAAHRPLQHCTGVMGRSGCYFSWQLGAGERHLAELLRSTRYPTSVAGANDVGAVPVARTGSFVAPSVQAAEDRGGARRWGFEEAMASTRGQAVAQHTVRRLERNAHAKRRFYLQVGFLEAGRQTSVSGSGGARTARDSWATTSRPTIRWE